MPDLPPLSAHDMAERMVADLIGDLAQESPKWTPNASATVTILTIQGSIASSMATLALVDEVRALREELAADRSLHTKLFRDVIAALGNLR